MTIDRLINLLVTITLIEMMLALGLSVTLAEVIGAVRNARRMALALLANYIVVPAVTVGLIAAFHPLPMVSAGFLILAVCPGAPFGPPFAAIARGNVPLSVGLMVVLAGSSAVLAPLMLSVLLPLVSGDQPLKVDSVKLVTTLLVTQLLPLCAGVLVRERWPLLASRLQKPANLASKILNLLAVILILGAQSAALSKIHLLGLFGMLLLLVASLAAGFLLGGPEFASRKTLALTTALRNVAVSLVIASGNFAGTPALTAVLAFGLVEILGSLALALWWGRQNGSAQS